MQIIAGRRSTAPTPFGRGDVAFRGTLYSQAEQLPGYPSGCMGTVRSYHLTNLTRPISEQLAPGGRPAMVVVAPDGRAILTAGYFGGCVCVFPVDDGGALRPPQQVIHHTGRGVQTPRQHDHGDGYALPPRRRAAIGFPQPRKPSVQLGVKSPKDRPW